MSSDALARHIVDLAKDKKGEQIVLMNISEIASFTDFFVVVSASSNVQIKAIADHIEDELRKEGVRVNHKEGYQYQNWILLDYIDVIVHILKKDLREHYGIERLWSDAEIEYITEAKV